MDEIDLDLATLQVPHVGSPPTWSTRRGRFLKGPIPLAWLTAAACQPGRALHVAIAVSYLAGLTRASTVELRPSVVRQFGLNRYAAYRGLDALEHAGLVAVRRHRGRCPTVTILLTTEHPPTEIYDAQPA